ncbi:hypothetical protein ACFU7D_20415 [Nocardioides sp. NPDC057577]|uniref:hypothetical protein n=1 Tax=Nocardioides sp. NPDC057577 TaxID=3346171 RepID=UPI00366F81C6
MSRIDDLLRDAMGDPASPPPPSADLFARVVDGIAGDQVRRRTRRRVVAAIVLVAVVLGVVAYVNKIRELNGEETMPWWTLEILTTAILIGLALWLGPLIKRFGRAYAADVFHDNPRTGKSYIVLTDIVYYLIFIAYILLTIRFEPADSWLGSAGSISAAQLSDELARIAGILLVIGILHAVNIVLMPVLGRLFSLNRRLPPGSSNPG